MKEIQTALVVSAGNSAPGQTATQRLLAAVKLRTGIPSNYRLARELGLSDNTLTRWNQGRGTPADSIALQLADLAGLDGGLVLVELAAERAQDDETRNRLLGVVERLRQAGMAAMVGVIVSFAAPSPEAQAFEVLEHVDQSGLCVMSSRRRDRRRGGGRRKGDGLPQRRRGPKASPPQGLRLH